MKLAKAGIWHLIVGLGLIILALILGKIFHDTDVVWILVAVWGGVEIGRFVEAKFKSAK
jgi:hypothetical protein